MNRIGFVMHGLCSLAMAAGLAIAMALPAAAEVDYLDIGPDIGLSSEMQLAALVIAVESPAEYVAPEVNVFERTQMAQAPEAKGRAWAPLAYVSTPSIAASHLIGRAAFG